MNITGRSMGKISNWDIVFGAVGQAQAELYQGLANNDVPFVETAINLTCDINDAYSNTLANSAYEKSFINTLCGLTDNPVPQRENPGFTGGQCIGVSYGIQVLLERFDSNGTKLQDTTFTLQGIRGAIRRINIIPASDNEFEFFLSVANDAPDGSVTVSSLSTGIGFSQMNIKSILVYREDGQPDTCGDPLGEYPPSPERPDQFCAPVQTSKDLPPGTFDIVELEGCIPGDTDLKFPICISYGEFEICFDLDGIFKNPKGRDEEPPTAFDPDELDEEDPECTPPEDIELEENGESPEGVEACESETEELEWLLITITKFSDTSKIIAHQKEELSDYFAGYLCWKVKNKSGDFYFPAIPIRKQRNVYKPPEGINGYAVYTTNGAKVSIKEVKKKPKE